ncbi:MAG: tetratricopeptide repeat protein [Chitinophagaceae bacterium]
MVKLFLWYVILIIPYSIQAQDSTVKKASLYYQLGYGYYQNNKRDSALKYLELCNQILPSAITSYFLGVVYYNSGRRQEAINALATALNSTPPLNPKLTEKAKNLKNDIESSLIIKHEKTRLSANYSTLGPPAPTFTDNPYIEKSKRTRKPGFLLTTSTAVLFPGGGVLNFNKPIGDFCCTGETVTIYRHDSIPIGYIHFYTPDNVRNTDKNNNTTPTLTLQFSAARKYSDTSSARKKSEIQFDAATELYNGSIKTKKTGCLKFKVTILAVKKYDTVHFDMENIIVTVDVTTIK